MKQKRARKARKRISGPTHRRRRSRWKPYGGFVLPPVYGPDGSAAGVVIIRDGARTYGVAGVGFPRAVVDAAPSASMSSFLDSHSHAVIAERVRSLAEAKRLGEDWARKFRKWLVLAPCDCKDMVDKGAPPPPPTASEKMQGALEAMATQADGTLPAPCPTCGCWAHAGPCTSAERCAGCSPSPSGEPEQTATTPAPLALSPMHHFGPA